MNRTENRTRVLILTIPSQLPHDQQIWGTGGWTPPTEREALDWLVLVRTLGWNAVTIFPEDLEGCLRSLTTWDAVIIACDPTRLPQETLPLLETKLQRTSYSLIVRIPDGDFAGIPRPFACRVQSRVSGQALVWQGPNGNEEWYCRRMLEACRLETRSDTRVLATLDGAAIVTQRRHGAGRCVTMGFHPSAARDRSGEATSLLRRLLTCDPHVSHAWLDWSDTVVLRMDDPGGAQNVYSRSWCYRKLHRAQWQDIGKELSKRDARLSVGYVSGWVDDGNSQRTNLWVDNKPAPRKAGAIYDTPRVRCVDRAGHLPGVENDYTSEYQGIRELQNAGLVDVELHGYTHVHADLDAWLRAPDRYENRNWFRDFGQGADSYLARIAADQHPLSRALAAFKKYFEIKPVCLICPGDVWTNEVLDKARQLQLRLVSSYYLAIAHADRFVWSAHICAPYLDQAASRWFSSGLPVVGYFHDYEPATEGIGWFAAQLDQWREAGARRFIDFRETAAALSTQVHLENENGNVVLHLCQQPDAIAWPRPLPIRLRIHEGRLPDRVLCKCGQQQSYLPVRRKTETEGSMIVSDPAKRKIVGGADADDSAGPD